LLYVDKDKLELKEFLIDYNKIQAETLLKRLTVLKNQIDSNVIPLRLQDYLDNWQCNYCQFREICDMGEPGEMNWEDFKARIQGINSSET